MGGLGSKVYRRAWSRSNDAPDEGRGRRFRTAGHARRCPYGRSRRTVGGRFSRWPGRGERHPATLHASLTTAVVSPHVTLNQSWSVQLADSGGPVAESSPIAANLDGTPAVVVGDRTGLVWALHLNNGSYVAGWPYHEGAPVDSTPSVAAINAFGLDSVFVGSGNASNPTSGGYQGINPSGGDQWFTQETNPPTDATAHSGVQASLAWAPSRA